MSKLSEARIPRTSFPWLALVSAVVLAAPYLYCLAQLNVSRQGIVEDLLVIPDAFQTPIKTFSPPRPPYRGSVLLVHGYGGSKEMLQGFGADLAREGFYTFCLDLPGCGDSEQSFDRHKNLPALESAYFNLLGRGLVFPDKVALVGHSMGGALVLQFAAEHEEVRAAVALSTSPSNVSQELLRNLLLLTAEQDIPALHDAASRFWANVGGTSADRGQTRGDFAKGSARRAVTIPGANHLTILYSTAAREEIRSWFRGAFGMGTPTSALHERNTWIAGAHATALLLFVPLILLAAALYRPGEERVELIGTNIRSLVILWTLGCAAGAWLAAAVPVRPLVPLQLADYISWAGLLIGLIVLAGAWLLKVRIRISEWTLVRPLVLAGGAFVYLYWSVGAVANEEWLHLGLAGSRWEGMVRIAVLVAPLFLLLELFLRDSQRTRGMWRSVWMSWLCYAVLFAGLLSPALLSIGNVDRFLLLMSAPFLVVFFVVFSVLSAVLYRATGSILCTATWNVLTYAWIFAAPMFWK